jgi:outer membrane lipoprotein SlyB
MTTTFRAFLAAVPLGSGDGGCRSLNAALAALLALLLSACATPPAFQVTEPQTSRIGTVESVVQHTVQNSNAAIGTIAGALLGGVLGNQIGGGRGQTAATVVGAAGGAFAGNRVAKNNTSVVWRIDVRYDDGSVATIQQTVAPALRVGDRVRVSSSSLERVR